MRLPRFAASIALALLLVGCTSQPLPERSPSPSSPAATSEAAAPLTCQDLATEGLVAQALTPADGVVPTPVMARDPQTWLAGYAVDVAGGITCSWRTGDAPIPGVWPGSWAYLTVRVLPHAATEWIPWGYGDGPTDAPGAFRDVAGIPTLAVCGDPGCLYSAPVADAWVQVEATLPGLAVDHGMFAGSGIGGLDRIQPVAESVFAAIAAADDSRLPTPIENASSDCSVLDPAAIATALGRGTVTISAVERSPLGADFGALASERSGLVTCNVLGEFPGSLALITIGAAFGPVVEVMRTTPDSAGYFPEATFAGATGPALARPCPSAPDGACGYVFSVGGAAYSLDGSAESTAIAEAVIASVG